MPSGGYCDLWLTDELEKVPPFVLFFDGAVSIEDTRARENEQIHLPFFQQFAEDIFRFASVPFNFVAVPGDFTPLSSVQFCGCCSRKCRGTRRGKGILNRGLHEYWKGPSDTPFFPFILAENIVPTGKITPRGVIFKDKILQSLCCKEPIKRIFVKFRQFCRGKNVFFGNTIFPGAEQSHVV